MRLYVLYDAEDPWELPLIVGDAKELASWMNVTYGSFRCGVTRSTPFAGRYRVVKVKEEEEDVDQ